MRMLLKFLIILFVSIVLVGIGAILYVVGILAVFGLSSDWRFDSMELAHLVVKEMLKWLI